MKKIKILLLLVAVSVATFYSCSDNNPIENEAVAESSVALRTAMNELKIANNIADNRNANAAASSPFCFDFVYPLTVSYNTGTTVTVSSLQGLLNILANENPNLYLSGISFPFQVMHNGAVSTISTEGQFITLLMGCGFNTINTDLLNSMCFDIVYPITLVNPNNQIVAIASQQEFTSYLSDPAVAQSQISYPISVIYGNQTLVIDNIYEMYQMINNCDDCICTQQYDPVCVQTPTGIVEYGNSCFAQCAGFTQSDFVNCNSSTVCNITNLTTTITGNCNSDFSYPLTINFQYANAPSATFTVRKSTGAILGTYALANLPITISNYVSNTNATDFLTVELGGNSCTATQNWTLPNCGSTTSNFGTQLGNCFNIAYPVQVQHQGALVTVTSNSQLLQYYFPAVSPIPAFSYPVTATFGNQTVTIQTQSAFQSFIQANCN